MRTTVSGAGSAQPRQPYHLLSCPGDRRQACGRGRWRWCEQCEVAGTSFGRGEQSAAASGSHALACACQPHGAGPRRAT